MTNEKGNNVSDAEMLSRIWDEIRYVRERLDNHIDDEDSNLIVIRGDITGIKETMSGHKAKLGVMFAGMGLAMSGIVAWVITKVSSIS